MSICQRRTAPLRLHYRPVGRRPAGVPPLGTVRQVIGHQPELVTKRAFILLVPAEMVLRPAVDEQDRRPVRLAPLAYVQLQAATALHRVSLHRPCRLPLCYRRHLSPPRVRCTDSIVVFEKLERLGQRALSSAAGLPICRWRDAYERLSPGASRAILAAWNVALTKGCAEERKADAGCACSGASGPAWPHRSGPMRPSRWRTRRWSRCARWRAVRL